MADEGASVSHVESLRSNSHEMDPGGSVAQLDDDVRDTGAFHLSRGKSLEEVLAFLAPFGEEQKKAFADWHAERRERTYHLDLPTAWRDSVVDDIKQEPWYPGPNPATDVAWRGVEPILRDHIGDEATEDVDLQTSKIVSSLANPNRLEVSMRGLVVGYVQSGKTANYTATIAKAVDAGYRMVIVLAGIHNALRQQTQRRLDRDLVDSTHENRRDGDWHWYWLTEDESDFDAPKGSADALLSARDLRLVAVVKKNKSRLTRLVNWLASANPSVRRQCPVLIIDDEADQASVNTAREAEATTAINGLIRDLVRTMPTNTYVGYTATPFANVLIDPNAPDDLYPRNFIFALPQPAAYQGAEVLFGRNDLDEEDSAFDGYDVLRLVPTNEMDQLVPPTSKEKRGAFSPTPVPTLEESLRWFALATSARRARGQRGHSSMLVHTTRYTEQHFDTADLVRKLYRGFSHDDVAFEKLWEEESSRDTPPTSGRPLSWDEVRAELPSVLSETSVIVDNGRSEDRLDYTDEPQTVIAVGGDTLSRGLTLEGLVSSYFLRGAGSYDSLMQMGRWFGYRPGYEDLPRIWTEAATAEAFRFLSTVEEEIRRDIARFESESLTPSELAVKIRSHPQMSITSALKMQHATKAQVSYSGRRLQTFLFRHRDRDWLASNLEAGRELVAASQGARALEHLTGGRTGWAGVPTEAVARFLNAYRFHDDHVDLDGDRIQAWLQRRASQGAPATWNVVVMGRKPARVAWQGSSVELGTVDFGCGIETGAVNRARMAQTSKGDRADIKALMSSPDRVVDLPDVDPKQPTDDLMEARGDSALLLLYPISSLSVPIGSQTKSTAREPLNAAEHVLGVGLVFPPTPPGLQDDPLEYDYVQVRLVDADPELPDEEEAKRLEDDDEGDARPDMPEDLSDA